MSKLSSILEVHQGQLVKAGNLGSKADNGIRFAASLQADCARREGLWGNRPSRQTALPATPPLVKPPLAVATLGEAKP